MNYLTKVLLEDLLDNGKKKITAIYGGGFKPPTKGHFDVIEKAAEQNPEIDDIILGDKIKIVVISAKGPTQELNSN
jgi:cytidyltransferase-like protein